MSDAPNLPREPEEIVLPNGVVVGYGTGATRTTDPETGEEHPLTIVSFRFQVAPGIIHQQSFVLHADDGAQLRRDLKNPTPITEETN